jgi:tRNA modification GTPase
MQLFGVTRVRVCTFAMRMFEHRRTCEAAILILEGRVSFLYLIYQPLSMRVLVRAWRTRGSVLLAKTRPSVVACYQLECLRGGKTTSTTNTTRHLGILSEHTKQTRYYSGTTHRINGDSTIYALSTAPGRGAIAIIRISGPACLSIYRALCPGKKDPKARHATVRTLYDPTAPPTPSSVLDSGALVLYFPAPKTVTGEDLLELHVHGGTAIVRAVLAAIAQAKASDPLIGPIRYAEPGEFTRRAFANDRLDLTQVEALGDSLAATTEQQRRLSVRGTTNSLANRYESWRRLLLEARGELEALIDFSEDQHFDESIAELLGSVYSQVNSLRKGLLAHRENAVRGELLRSGISLALLGAPNAGKSSLLNAVVGREAAIVSREAGTTRDIVEVGIDLGGFLCRLGDTAGLRKALGGVGEDIVGLVEQEGMRRAKARAEESDVVIVVLSFECEGSNGRVAVRLDPEVVETAARLVKEKDNILVVINKTDTVQHQGSQHFETALAATQAAIPGLSRSKIHLISCTTAVDTEEATKSTPGNNSIQLFLRALIEQFTTLTSAISPDTNDAEADPSIWQESLGATERHRLLLETCIASLEDFTALVEAASEDAQDGEADIVLAAEFLRDAGDSLARITGRGEAGDVEEVLGVVFEKFCVGK